MPRTTKKQVQELIPDVDTKISMTGFIETASALVDWLVNLDAGDTTPQLSSGSLPELIERWLAAHFYSKRDTQYQQSNTGRAAGTVEGQSSMVLMGSRWGQQACLLDVTGRLSQRSKDAELGTRRVASVHGPTCRTPRSGW